LSCSRENKEELLETKHPNTHNIYCPKKRKEEGREKLLELMFAEKHREFLEGLLLLYT
jgi:hypothetical protein